MKSKKSIVLSDNKVALITMYTALPDDEQQDKIKKEYLRLEHLYNNGEITEDVFEAQTMGVVYVSHGESCTILRSLDTFDPKLTLLDVTNIHDAMSRAEEIHTINIYDWVNH